MGRKFPVEGTVNNSLDELTANGIESLETFVAKDKLDNRHA